MIVSNISHGFGNQLFQYAAGFAAARRAGTELRIDTRYFRRAKDRAFQLDRLTITARHISVWQEAKLRLTGLLPEAPWARPIRRGLLGVGTVLREQNLAYEPRLLTTGPDTLLIGFWQDETYFADYADDLRREFTFKEPPNDYNRDILAQMAQQTSVCVHVRRGDYVAALNSSLPVCSLDYYRAALDQMMAAVPKARYFVFSDDPDWTRANLVLPEGSVFVTGNVGVSDTDDLRLMSHGNHFIIANSTFSWWAAWLAKEEGKIVIAPSPWFRPGMGNESIVPGRWRRIHREVI